VMLPWWLRNGDLTGRFVPTTLQVGASLYDGLNPRATGASDMWFVDESPWKASVEDEESAIIFEVGRDRHFRDKAVAWASANSGRAAQLAVAKVTRMWNVWPNEASLSRPAIRWAVVLTYLPVMLLGLVGAIRTFRLGWPYILCWLPAVYFTLLHAVFVGSLRYRQPAMLGVIVLAAGMLGVWFFGKKSGDDASEESLGEGNTE